MGWSYYHATKYKSNGSVDRKAEIDHSGWGDKLEVLKSSMVGSTYYAAVRNKETGKVWCAVFLTATVGKDHFNFGYKDMCESMGPTEAKCPVGILNLLTDTDDEYAIKWRERCRQYHADKKSPTSFANLPLGTKIIWTVPHEFFANFQKGQKIELVKSKIGKRLTAWVNWAGRFRINAKSIDAEDVEIITGQ
jgi:hypothetical protein